MTNLEKCLYLIEEVKAGYIQVLGPDGKQCFSWPTVATSDGEQNPNHRKNANPEATPEATAQKFADLWNLGFFEEGSTYTLIAKPSYKTARDASTVCQVRFKYSTESPKVGQAEGISTDILDRMTALQDQIAELKAQEREREIEEKIRARYEKQIGKADPMQEMLAQMAGAFLQNIVQGKVSPAAVGAPPIQPRPQPQPQQEEREVEEINRAAEEAVKNIHRATEGDEELTKTVLEKIGSMDPEKLKQFIPYLS